MSIVIELKCKPKQMTPKLRRTWNIEYLASIKCYSKIYTSIVFKFADAERYNEDLFRISFKNQDLFWQIILRAKLQHTRLELPLVKIRA